MLKINFVDWIWTTVAQTDIGQNFVEWNFSFQKHWNFWIWNSSFLKENFKALNFFGSVTILMLDLCTEMYYVFFSFAVRFSQQCTIDWREKYLIYSVLQFKLSMW